MKKLFLISFLFILSISIANSIDFSLSHEGSTIDGDVKREGDYVYMNFKLGGVSQLAENNDIAPEARENMQNISNLNFKMVASCTEPKAKILSLSVFDLGGARMTEQEEPTGWIQLTNQKDIDAIRSMCEKTSN